MPISEVRRKEITEKHQKVVAEYSTLINTEIVCPIKGCGQTMKFEKFVSGHCVGKHQMTGDKRYKAVAAAGDQKLLGMLDSFDQLQRPYAMARTFLRNSELRSKVAAHSSPAAALGTIMQAITPEPVTVSVPNSSETITISRVELDEMLAQAAVEQLERLLGAGKLFKAEHVPNCCPECGHKLKQHVHANRSINAGGEASSPVMQRMMDIINGFEEPQVQRRRAHSHV